MKTKLIRIADVKPGMRIKTSLQDGTIVFKEVTDVFRTPVPEDQQVKVVFENGTTVHCSTNHPFMVWENGTMVQRYPVNLTEADKVCTERGFSRILTVDVGQSNDPEYIDITVEDTHTFFTKSALDQEAVLTHNSQGGIRNASATVNFPIWHYQFDDLIVLKNNQGTDENRVRHLDYCVVMNKFFWRRFKEQGVITFFDPNEVPELYEAFYSNTEKFEQLYVKYEKRKDLRTKIQPAEVVIKDWLLKERGDTGRYYLLNIDNVMNQGPLDPAIHPVYQTNLCFSGDTLVAVADGRNAVSMAQLESEGVEFNVFSAAKALGKSTTRSSQAGGKVDMSDWKTVIRKARAIKTGELELVRVHLDDGDFFDATPNHRLATTKYGQWIEAGQSLGAELEPLKRTDELYRTGREVVRVERLGVQACYDVQVLDHNLTDDEHNFYLITSGDADYRTFKGVLVHNCTEIMLHTREFQSIDDAGELIIEYRGEELRIPNTASARLTNGEIKLVRFVSADDDVEAFLYENGRELVLQDEE